MCGEAHGAFITRVRVEPHFVHDALNRLTEKNYPDSTSAEYTYDLVGKILQVNDPTGTYAFAYDNMGRLIGTTTTYSFLPGMPFTNAYTYDADSNRTGYTAPDGSTNSYSYDALNRLTTLANSWAGSFGFSYDSLSRRTQMTRPNGIATNYTYDSLSRLLSVLHQSGSTIIDGDVYTLDAAGNRTAKQDDLAGVTSNYTYDKIYELTQVTQGSSTTESYSYDPVGNRLSSLGVPSYTVNSSNELTANSNASYTYDNNGNTTSKTNSSGTTNYAWDYENRLTQVTLPGTGGTETYRYDPFGRHIQKIFTQNGTAATTNYVYDDENEVETVDQNGAILSRFAQSSNVDEPLAESVGGATYDYEQDGLGSVTSLTNASGALAQTYIYDSFGNTMNSSGNIANPFRFTGRDFDSETGLYNFRRRYVDPAAGRFTSEDPIGWGGGIDLYEYVKNQVDVLNDPRGEEPDPETKCLVCTVYGESRGTPSACQYGVASIILNRLGDARKKNPDKPTSICDIVSAPGQFDAYNGRNYKNCVNGCAPSNDQPDLNQTWKLFGQPFKVLSGAYFFGNATPKYEQYFRNMGKYPVPNQYCPKLVFYGGPWP